MGLELGISADNCTRGQWRFLNSRAPVALLSGGFGSGKTLGLGLKLLQLKSENPDAPGLLMAQTWRALYSVTLRRFMGFCKQTMPKRRWPQVQDKNGECFLDFGDGVPIFLRSADNPASFDGLDVGYGLGDELRHWSKQSYEVFLGRIRTKCPMPQAAFSSTPAMNFMYEEFGLGKAKRDLIISPTKENLRNLSPDFIDNLRLSYSKRLQRAVLDGQFTILEGAVYEEFDPLGNSPWFVDYDPTTAINRKTYLAVDPGFRKSSWLWIHEITPTEWVVFDEFQGESMSDMHCVSIVNNKPWQIDEIWCDPASDNTQGAIGIDTIQMLARIKARGQKPVRYITGVHRGIEYGVDKIRTMLGDPANGLPIRVKFAKRLLGIERGKSRGLVRSLSSYRYPQIKENKPVGNLPLKDGLTDHDCDALRYWGIGMWLTSPLRTLDPTLAAMGGGYKIAA